MALERICQSGGARRCRRPDARPKRGARTDTPGQAATPWLADARLLEDVAALQRRRQMVYLQARHAEALVDVHWRRNSTRRRARLAVAPSNRTSHRSAVWRGPPTPPRRETVGCVRSNTSRRPCLAGGWTSLSGDFQGDVGRYYLLRTNRRVELHSPSMVSFIGAAGRRSVRWPANLIATDL
jgi:hypothetical protein